MIEQFYRWFFKSNEDFSFKERFLYTPIDVL